MAKFRNITDTTLWVDTGGPALVKVEPGAVVDIPDTLYVQTGETGEEPLWEPVVRAARPKKEN